MPEPKAERLYDLEAGYSYMTKKIRLNTNVYFMNYKDQLVLTGKINDVGSPVMTNVDRSFRSGIELSIESDPFTWLSWDFNTTFSRNRIKSFTDFVVDFDTYPYTYMTDDMGETEIAFSPSWIGSNCFTFNLPYKVKLSLGSKYVGKQYIDNTSSSDRMLDAYFVNDLGVAYVFSKKTVPDIQLNFRINNVLNHHYESNAWVYRYYYAGEYYEDNGYFPQAGRHVLLGIKVRF